MANKKYVAWRRVSTFKQNSSGLGLEAQKAIIDYFVQRDGGTLIADFAECYTGKDLNGCVELRKAIAYAKQENAILIIAKSDRFRNCQEALGILDAMGDGNIEFCDIPHTDRFTLTLFFALAEREALLVSIRTRQALQAKKRRGEAVGGASIKWKTSYEQKSETVKRIEGMKRGEMKRTRYLESKDVRAFVRVLQRAFPDDAVGDDVSKWNWKGINTCYGSRMRVLSLMNDYKAIDSTLFYRWDFTDIGSRALQVKLATYMRNLRRSVQSSKKEIEYA